MELDTSTIEYSKNDLNNHIHLPQKLTPDLAEFIGIIVGDGHLDSNGYHKQIVITGNINDFDYYNTHVKELAREVFGIEFTLYFQKSRNAVIIQKHSKGLFDFLHRIIGIPTRKDEIQIPLCILNDSNECKARFLRGLADADFCFTLKRKDKSYPVIHGTSKSERLIMQVQMILKEFDINCNTLKETSYYAKREKSYTRHRVYINGHKNVRKFMKIIGFSNQNVLIKFNEYKNKNGPEGI